VEGLLISQKPEISVIIATYNRASSFLRYAIQSVLRQTVHQFELIVVDDASTDNTEEVVRSFRDPRILYVRLARHTGTPSIPRNVGTLISQGTYIAYLDDDNEYLPCHLEVLHNALLDNPEVVGVYGDRSYIRKCPLAIWKEKPGMDWDVGHLLCTGNYIDTSDLMLRREVLYTIGGWNPSLSIFTDWDLVARIAISGFALMRVPLVITEYNWHWGNLGHTLLRIATKKIMLMHVRNASIVQAGLDVAAYHLSTAHVVSWKQIGRTNMHPFVHSLEIAR